jgi:hypothetical protein
MVMRDKKVLLDDEDEDLRRGYKEEIVEKPKNKEIRFEEEAKLELKRELERDDDKHLKFLDELQEEPAKDASKDQTREEEIEETLETKERKQILETLLEHPFTPFQRGPNTTISTSY